MRSILSALSSIGNFRLLACLWFAISVSAQQPDSQTSQANYPPQLLKDLVNLRDAALDSEYAYKQVAELSENIGPRMAGSPQAEYAVEYVANELRKLGLDVHLEEVKVRHWVRGVESGELVQYAGQASESTQRLALTALGGSGATPVEGITADVIVVGSFDELKSLGREGVAGKIVLFNVHFDEKQAAGGYSPEAYEDAVAYRSTGAKAAAALGAVGSLVRSLGTAAYRLPHTGYSEPAGIPAGAVSVEDADLISHLTRQGTVRLHLTLTPRVFPEVVSHNIVADIRGTEHPEQVVIISAHLDSWDLGTGATDDGAGVAIALEAAHLVQQYKLHPKRTIRLIAWMDEENSGRGREAYERLHRVEFANHVGAIESDAGAGYPMGFLAKMKPEGASLLSPMLEVLKSIGATVLRNTSDSPGFDLELLANAGVPCFAPLQDTRSYFHYHHTAADTLDKIVPRELQENAAAVVVLGYTLANLPATLRIKLSPE
jgi:hypothetical protein